MVNDVSMSADIVAMFCRLQMNAKRDLPIRSSEMGVLIFTQKQNNSVTPIMISRFFKITKPSVTAMINSLIKSGYLIKTPSTKDNRSYNVSVSNKGADLIQSKYNEYIRTMELLKERMGSKEFDLFIELMNKANNILSEEI